MACKPSMPGPAPVDRRRVLATAAAAAAGLAGPARALETTADGAQVYWTSAGKGPRALIFVHGWTGDLSLWDRQVADFSKHYRVIALDLPGHGRSAQPVGGVWSMAMFAQAVEAVRAAAGVEKAVLIGHSMGALVVRQYALTHPARVEALVLADGLMRGPPTGAPAPARVLTGEEGRRNREQMVRGMFVGATPPQVRKKALAISLKTAEVTAAGAMAAILAAPWDPTPVRAPVLGIYADRSRLSNPEVIKAIYPTLEYHELPGTGHFLMMEQPEAFDALLERFLAGLAWTDQSAAGGRTR